MKKFGRQLQTLTTLLNKEKKINKIIDNGVGNKTLDEIKKVLNINDITEILAILSKEDLMEFMSKWEIVEEIPRTIFQTVLQQNPEKERLIDEIQQRFFNKLKESSHIQELTRHELKLLNITENDLENPLLQPIIDELEICLAKDLCIKRSPSIMPTFTKYNHLNTDNSKQKIAVASAILQFYYFTPDEQDYLNQKIDDIMVQLNNIKNSNDPLAKQTLDEILFKMYTKEDLFANLPKEPTTTLGYILNPISNFWGKYIVDPIINNEKIRGMISTATTLGAGSAALSSQIPIIGQSPISSGILSATAVLLGGYIGYKYPKLQYVLTPIQSLKNEIYNIVDLKKSFIHKTFRLGMIGLSTAGMLAGVGTLLITATSPLSLPVLGLATLGVLATPMITLAVANITKKIAEKSSFLFYGTEYPDLYYPSEKAINMFKSNNNSNKEALNKMLTISSHFINVTKDIKILMRKYSDEATIKQLKIHLEEIEKIWQQDLQNGNHNGLKRFITLAKIIKIQKKPITPEALYKLRDILIEDYASIDKMSIHKDKTTSLLFQQSQTFMQQKDAIINAELKNLTALENELNVTSKSMSR
jgi:type III secretion system FlhB-like substrate exporter